MHTVDLDLLNRLLCCDSDTGMLYWRERTEIDCANPQERKRWNTRYAGKPAMSVNASGYVKVCILGVSYQVHRVVWALSHGEWPSDVIDHINGDTADNRLCNLRAVSREENMRNKARYQKNKSGVPGVGWNRNRNKWAARIKVAGVDKHIGLYASFDEAVAARKAAEAECNYHPNHGRAPMQRNGAPPQPRYAQI